MTPTLNFYFHLELYFGTWYFWVQIRAYGGLLVESDPILIYTDVEHCATSSLKVGIEV